jgi:hypothetical protein
MGTKDFRKAILIGVNHRIQYTQVGCGSEWSSDIRAFEDHLVALASTMNADLVAEEFNEESVERNSATSCTVRDAAQRASCKHLYCDPNTSERTTSGASSNQREEEWLRRILAVSSDRLLMVCGDNHVDSFCKRLNLAGYTVIIDSRNWGSNWMERD